MNGGRGGKCAFGAAALGFWLVGLNATPGLAQGPAEVLAESFRKAAQRVQSAVVAVRALEESRPALPMVLPPRGPFGPGPLVPPLAVPAGEPDREPGGSGLVIDA